MFLLPHPLSDAIASAAALLMLTTGCNPSAVEDHTSDAAKVTPAGAGAEARVPSARVQSREPERQTAAGSVHCPAVLAPNATVPAGARLIGSAVTTLPLTTATVTMNAPAAISDTTDGMAEVEPDDGPDDPADTKHIFANPTAELPFTLVCYYGRWRLPGTTPAVLLLPLPAGSRYTCTAVTPQDANPKQGSAICVPQGSSES